MAETKKEEQNKRIHDRMTEWMNGRMTDDASDTDHGDDSRTKSPFTLQPRKTNLHCVSFRFLVSNDKKSINGIIRRL